MRILKSIFSFERVLGMLLLVAFLGLYYGDTVYKIGLVEGWRNKVFDYYQEFKPRDIPPADQKPVTIIDLDEQSLESVGQWPWPRTTIAKMIQNTMQMGAVLIAFDIVFAEPDRLNPQNIAESIVGLDPETKSKLVALKSNDQVLADTIRRSRVVLGQAGRPSETEGVKGPPVKKSVAIRKLSKDAPEPYNFIPKFPSLVRNVSAIELAATHRFGGHGVFSTLTGKDGIVRSVPSLFGHEGEYFPTLSIEMLRIATGRPTVLARVNSAGMVGVAVAKGLEVQTDRIGQIWPYFSKHDQDKYVSAVDVLNGSVDPAMMKGKLTIVGTSAVGLRDIRSIPTERDIPGVEVHAQLIEAIIHQKYLVRPNYADVAELTFLLVGGIIMIILVPWVGAKWTAGLFLVVAGGALGTSWYLFTEKLVLLDATYAVVGIAVMYTSMTYAGYAREEAERRQTRDAFSKYLSPDMVERVAGDPGALKLGGDQRQMTLLFCDVRGFTTISEQFDAVGLTSLINKLLTPLTNVILERKGTIDKYMGDCIMAFWNAPLDDDDQEYNGCTSALAMLAEMEPLNERLKQEAEEEGRKHIPLKVGLGLNTGPCVVGNMGSDMRFDYSVLGDAVNLAARLEGQSKSYGMNVVLGPTTRNAVKDRLATIDLDFIQVKGKTEGTYIYGLMGDEEVLADPAFKKLQNLIYDAQEMYRAQQWDDAQEMFDEIRDLGSDAKKPWKLEANLHVLCDLYDERIAEYRENPPPPDWDGVYIATTK
ncbi:MAG: adenylate/guanylate cyclase domain-containing protein [Rhodospirillales bacterium]|nr:adenylate/guanylate cyclase domain-containing protein [Rhodospirillales bacterium]MBO6787001.1 adenylate/guanylate cyclase domain-containing protein [Rhodospirillales bacterium]